MCQCLSMEEPCGLSRGTTACSVPSWSCQRSHGLPAISSSTIQDNKAQPLSGQSQVEPAYLLSWTVELLPHMRLPIWNSLGIPFLVRTSLKSDNFNSFTKFVECPCSTWLKGGQCNFMTNCQTPSYNVQFALVLM